MQEGRPWYLYKVTNRVNGKMYIGISATPSKRKQQHFFQRKHRAVSILHLAINKYGHENFDFDIICIGLRDYISALEVKAIALYRTREKPFGYNIKPGGETGRGYSIRASKRDTPQYVSGFWFPNVRTASKSMCLSVSIIKMRRKKGTLGDVKHKNLRGSVDYPTYVAGFWWENLHQAALILGVKLTALRSRVTKRSLEQARKHHDQSGEKGSMYGVSQKDHPASKPVCIDGVAFDSIKQATEQTGYSKFIITTRIKDGIEGFSFL